MRALGGCLVAAVLLAAFVLPAGSDRGVGVTLGQIQIDEPVRPGGRYVLPSIGVVNTGGQTDRYRISHTRLSNQPERWPGRQWLSFQPDAFSLGPGESRQVDLVLTVPVGAEPGAYFAIIEAIVGDEGSDAMLAAAGTKLTFTVAPATWLQAQRTRLERWLEDASPWLELTALAVLLLLALRWLSRRVRFRLPFEPR